MKIDFSHFRQIRIYNGAIIAQAKARKLPDGAYGLVDLTAPTTLF